MDVQVSGGARDGWQLFCYVPQIAWQENCYVAAVDGDCFLVDPGFDCEGVGAFLRERGWHLRCILLTHAHHDHVASVAALQQAFPSVPAYLHPRDRRLLMHAPLYAMRFARRTCERPQDIRWLDETGAQELAEAFGIHVLHTPGHTHGGVCYVCRDACFTGDTLLAGKLGRTDLPEGDRTALEASVQRLLEAMPAGQTLFPGHHAPWTADEARAWWQDQSISHEEQRTF